LRGQILSTDLVISLSMFLAALLIFLLVWSTIAYAYRESLDDIGMQSALISISDALAFTPGSPPGWEFSAANASSYGIAASRNHLSPAKLSALSGQFSSNYTGAKERIGAGRFDIFVSVERAEGGEQLYGFGRLPSAAGQQISSAGIERLCMLEGELVKVKVQLWRKKGGSL
jgi:hypothetical protein